MKRWEDAKDGDGQSVLLVGEAGIGKSRLLERVRDPVRSERNREIALFCSPLHQTSALWPVAQFLRRALVLDQSVEMSRARIRTWVQGLQLENSNEAEREVTALMLGQAEADIDPTTSRQILFSALAEAFWASAPDNPMLLVLEDAHWIDPSTSELIGRLLLRLRERRALILITARPEFRPSWRSAQVVTLPLTQFNQGIEDLRQGYQIWRGQGVVFHTPERACALCDALISAGYSIEVEEVLNEIDQLVAGTDERSFEAECIRAPRNDCAG
jgi:predicted ATPase